MQPFNRLSGEEKRGVSFVVFMVFVPLPIMICFAIKGLLCTNGEHVIFIVFMSFPFSIIFVCGVLFTLFGVTDTLIGNGGEGGGVF